MILVTGATGKLGKAVLERLAQNHPAEQLRATARDPGKAADLASMGIAVHQADYEDRGSLVHAFEGVDQVLMVSSNAAAYGRDPLVQHANVIAAAKEAGVARLVYTSHMAAGMSSKFPPMKTHAATETMLAESGIAWTALRDGFYASSLFAIIRDGLANGILAYPKDGKVCWTGHADLADAAAAVLGRPGEYEGPTPPLVSEEAFDLSDIADLAASITGRKIVREEINVHEMTERLAGRGLPPVVIDITLGMFAASADGEFFSGDRTLSGLIGRPTATMRELLSAALAA